MLGIRNEKIRLVAGADVPIPDASRFRFHLFGSNLVSIGSPSARALTLTRMCAAFVVCPDDRHTRHSRPDLGVLSRASRGWDPVLKMWMDINSIHAAHLFPYRKRQSMDRLGAPALLGCSVAGTVL